MKKNTTEQYANSATEEPLSVISTVDTIMERIAVAKPRSPIAVFKGKRGLIAVFGSTVKTFAMRNDKNFVGLFDNTQHVFCVRETLLGARSL